MAPSRLRTQMPVILLFWTTMGVIAAGEVAVRRGPLPVGMGFLLALHVPHWLAWGALTPPVVLLCRRTDGWRATIALHAVLLPGVIAAHSAMVAAWDLVIVPPMAISLTWHGVFGHHLANSAVKETLGYVVVVGTAYALARRRSGAARDESPPPAPAAFRQRLAVRQGASVVVVPVEDVQWLEASNNYVRIHSTLGRFAMRQSLGKLAEQLDPRCFVRIHRSTVVNTRAIARLDSAGIRRIWLTDGTVLRASLRGWQRLRQIVDSSRSDSRRETPARYRDSSHGPVP